MANSIQILKNTSTDITSCVNHKDTQGTIQLTKQVGTFYFTIDVTPQNVAKIPVLNDQIDVWVNGTYHYFGGTVTSIETIVQGGVTMQLQITATDWSFKLNKLLVKKNYANEDPADIVLDILESYTDGSYGTSFIQRGNFLLPTIKFNYQSVTKAIQALATLIGWDWNVDADKNVHFFLVENRPAPFNLDDTTGNLEWRTIDLTQDLTNMKNSVTVVGSTYPKEFTALNTPDKFKADGTQSVWSLAYPYQVDPAIGLMPMAVTLNGVGQTIGNALSDNPADFQVMYSDSGRWIQFTSTPSAGQTIVVYGTAVVPIVAHASDPVGIAAYGEIEDVISDSKITTVAEAYLRAQADILQYGHAVNDLKFSTLLPGLFPGQQITLNSAILNGIPGQQEVTLTVKTVTLAPYGPNQFEYQVEAIGSDVVSFVDIMGLLLQQEVASTAVDDSTVVEDLVPVTESLTPSDSVGYTATSGPYQFAPGSPNAVVEFSKFA
jgi:hypothetical protein